MGKQTGVALLVVGIILLIAGVVLMSMCTASFFGMCIQNAYAGVGGLALVGGIVLLIVGAVLAYQASEAANPPQVYAAPGTYGYMPAPYGYAQPQGPGYPPPPGYPGQQPVAYGAPSQAPAASGGGMARVCPGCGTPVSAQFCASCGRQQW